MARLVFEKCGRAVWISHLDLMRLFQRAFQRAGLNLKHTQGFNPRPFVSIALPLSVGTASCCEILDFELEGSTASCEEICQKLNAALIDGIQVLQVYEGGRKLKDLSFLSCELTLEYDNGCAADAAQAIETLFRQSSIIVEKKGKNGSIDQDILPMIHSVKVETNSAILVKIHAVVCCQNPSLNPMLLASAVTRYLPHFKPDHVFAERLEIYDTQMQVFR